MKDRIAKVIHDVLSGTDEDYWHVEKPAYEAKLTAALTALFNDLVAKGQIEAQSPGEAGGQAQSQHDAQEAAIFIAKQHAAD